MRLVGETRVCFLVYLIGEIHPYFSSGVALVVGKCENTSWTGTGGLGGSREAGYGSIHEFSVAEKMQG